MFDIADQAACQDIGVLLLPACGWSELGLLLDCVACLNQLAEHPLYRVRLFTPDASPAELGLGRKLEVDGGIKDVDGLAMLFLAAAELPAPERTPLLAEIAKLGRRVGVLGGWQAGSAWLAQAGLLNGKRATTHWRLHESFSERYPQVVVSSNLYEVDGERVSCGGGVAVADLFLHLAALKHGADLCASVSEHLLLDRLRGREERQRIPLRNRVGSANPKLVQAVTLMEANLEEPLTTDEIAQHVCVSRRQLERLFKQHLEKVPSQYYLELRLNRAREHLRQTSKSIIQIGLSCGFSSGPHFSSAYRNHFGNTPREDRQKAGARHASPDTVQASNPLGAERNGKLGRIPLT